MDRRRREREGDIDCAKKRIEDLGKIDIARSER